MYIYGSYRKIKTGVPLFGPPSSKLITRIISLVFAPQSHKIGNLVQGEHL